MFFVLACVRTPPAAEDSAHRAEATLTEALDAEDGPPDSGPLDTGPTVPEACRQGTPAADRPELVELADGRPARLVEIESEAADPAWVLVVEPARGAYAGGAPVVVIGVPIMRSTHSFVAQLPEELGVVEVVPVYGGSGVGEVETGAEHDHGGPASATLLSDAFRFASGQQPSTEGWSLGEIVDIGLCGAGAALAGESSGGSPVAAALAAHPDAFGGRLFGLAAHENPAVPQFLIPELAGMGIDADDGVDADGDGYPWDDARYPLWDDDCDPETGRCAVDATHLAWDPAVNLAELSPGRYPLGLADGAWYLDLDGNGALSTLPGLGTDVDGSGAVEADEDFLFLPLDLDPSSHGATWFYSPTLTEAAEGLGGTWPEAVADLASSTAFWDERDMIHQLDLADLAGLRVVMDFTEVDHGVALPTRPHLWMFYEKLLGEAAEVSATASAEVVDCVLGEQAAGWSPGPAPSSPLDLYTLTALALPEVEDAQARATAVAQIFWESLGPFDRCPAD